MPLGFRLSPAWWPALLLAAPIVGPLLAARSLRFRRGLRTATERNAQRLAEAEPIELPALRTLALTTVVEHAHEPGFASDAAVSYLLRSDRGALLMDVGFGPEHPAFGDNAAALDLHLSDVDALFITHLHLDHMGGMAAQRARTVALPSSFAGDARKLCYVPDTCDADSLDTQVVEGPRLLEAGFATTGPLARMLFFGGLLEEQAVIARVEGKGLVLITGCGHPGIELLLKMTRELSDEPLHAVIGGLHYPITGSRMTPAGIEAQQIFGTGKPLCQRIDDSDLDRAIGALNDHHPKRLLLSAHDSCDHALRRFSEEVEAEVEVLRAGATYEL